MDPTVTALIHKRIEILDNEIANATNERAALYSAIKGKPEKNDTAKPKRKGMSAAARKAVSARMRKYWADRRRKAKAKE
jgi:hypothetical protein